MESDYTDSSQLQQGNNSNCHPVNVNVVINDPECATYVSSVGIFVMYYCDHCGVASDSLPLITEHIKRSGVHSVSDPDVSVKQHIDSITKLANEALLFPKAKRWKRKAGKKNESTEVNNKENTNILNGVESAEAVLTGASDEDEGMAGDGDIDLEFLSAETPSRKKKKKTKSSSSKNKESQTKTLMEVKKNSLIEDYINFVDENVDVVLSGKLNEYSVKEDENYTLSQIVCIEEIEGYDSTNNITSALWKSQINESTSSILYCKECPLVRLHGQHELDMHERCHTNDYPGYTFKCCLCRKRSTTVKTETVEWYQMSQHLQKVHDIHFKVKCSECSLEFESVESLHEHKNTVHRLFCKFKQDGCKYCTNSESDLKLHHNCHQTALEFHCCECDFKNLYLKQNTWALIREHIVENHPKLLDKNNQCPGCHGTFLDSESFNHHYEICEKVNSVKHKCMFCSKANFVPLLRLKEHLQKHCSSSSKTICTQFRKAFEMRKDGASMFNIYSTLCSSVKNYTLTKEKITDSSNISSSAKNPKHSDDVENFQCDEMNENNTDDMEEKPCLKEEQANDSTNSSVKGPTQNKVKTSNSQGIGEHSDSDIEENTEENLEESHEDDVSFKCNMCYKKLKSNKNLLRHMAKRHPLGHDRTQCKTCGKMFRTKSQCKNHYQYQHVGKKRKRAPYDRSKISGKLFYCESCIYTTPHPTRLRNHVMSVHLGVNPYKCDKCTYSTNEHSDLRRHKNKHLGIKKFECEHCDYRAAQRWLLANHCRKQHNIELPISRPKVDLLGSEGSLRRKHNKPSTKPYSKRDIKSGTEFPISKPKVHPLGYEGSFHRQHNNPSSKAYPKNGVKSGVNKDSNENKYNVINVKKEAHDHEYHQLEMPEKTTTQVLVDPDDVVVANIVFVPEYNLIYEK